MLGTFILWFGWYGFNSGNALLFESTSETGGQAALAATNTTLSAGTAGIVSLMSTFLWIKRTTGEGYFDLQSAMNGCLCGLVAITGGCGVVEPWAAVVTGFFAGVIFASGSRFLVHIRIDDAVDAIPVHLFGGIWGVLSVGLFASPTRLESVYHRSDHPGLLYTWRDSNSDGTLFGIQLIGLLFITSWVMFFMLPFFFWLDWKGWLRSDPLEELVGLDTNDNGEDANVSAEKEEIRSDHLLAYKKKRDSKNTEILRKRAAARGATSNATAGNGSKHDGTVDISLAHSSKSHTSKS
jgi:Amt family ammonium transporter